MKSLLELCISLTSDKSIYLEDTIDFLRIVYPICEGRQLDKSVAIKAAQHGLMPQIVQHYLHKVISNPYKFGLEVMQVFSKDGRIIKTIISNENNSIV